LEIH
jgi:hypothetical protein